MISSWLRKASKSCIGERGRVAEEAHEMPEPPASPAAPHHARHEETSQRCSGTTRFPGGRRLSQVYPRPLIGCRRSISLFGHAGAHGAKIACSRKTMVPSTVISKAPMAAVNIYDLSSSYTTLSSSHHPHLHPTKKPQSSALREKNQSLHASGYRRARALAKPYYCLRFFDNMTSTVYDEPYEEDVKTRNVESGYASGASEDDSLPEVSFSKQHLKFLNSQLQRAEPEGMLPLPHPTMCGVYADLV
ncbi:uncharacterized protein BDZ99DRAFT_179518 [Mytilinidion resinicola]|uniref:Uncharacterized protein n=1 Tax=Mytilinidion resinicola TaxID=574789 RepID=A0A6A6Y2L3_9PEZI|nr:uncharacterized protein BDZ99DRAFT_179518 [Mytilinidion resinicola]KAF2803032.1 hypothetical protein BDZ99DRAFT_179518 [Mytilinidion resinicola]